MIPKYVIVLPAASMYWATERATAFIAKTLYKPDVPYDGIVVSYGGREFYVLKDEYVPLNTFFRRLYGI